MKKERWIQAGCAAAAVCVIAGTSLLAKAGETLDVESAVAGVAVPLNNYYASSLNPEEELREFLDSDVIVNAGGQAMGIKTPTESGAGDVQQPSSQAPTQAPTEAPTEAPTQAPTEAPAEAPTETPTEAPTEASTETSAETVSQAPTEETSAQAPTEAPAESPAASSAAVAAQTEAPTEAPAPKVSRYADVAVSHVRDGSYVRVRSEPNTSSEVMGKLYNDCAATILNTVDGEDGQWYEIKSGSVRGYIKAEYFLTGDEAEARAIEIGKLEGRVNTNGLRLRSEPNLESDILTLLWSGEKYAVIEEGDEFVKVMVDDLEGYVFREMIDVKVKFDTAISLEEERQQKEEEERKKKEAAAAKKRLAEAKKAAKKAQESGGGGGDDSSSGSSSEVTSASRDALVSYAKQWAGVTPYVYGGTSLESGADCSGFTRAIYSNALGISIPRDSRSQASGGTSISESELQPGDLVFYNKSGTIDHVAIYIGGGQVVHASNSRTGTIISNMKYREPCKYVRYID